MRAVLQRVTSARVTVDGETVGGIRNGLLVLLGISSVDTLDDAKYLLEKTINLRIFDVGDPKTAESLLEIDGGLLVVSQFTLYADTKKGRRPSFVKAASADVAKNLYEHFVSEARSKLTNVQTGRFQAMMKVELVNDGPVTIILDTETPN